jgi:hypothetical protein
MSRQLRRRFAPVNLICSDAYERTLYSGADPAEFYRADASLARARAAGRRQMDVRG